MSASTCVVAALGSLQLQRYYFSIHLKLRDACHSKILVTRNIRVYWKEVYQATTLFLSLDSSFSRSRSMIESIVSDHLP